jgi:hypothetical protein
VTFSYDPHTRVSVVPGWSQERLRLLIRRKIQDGRLPLSVTKVQGSPSAGEKCDACEVTPEKPCIWIAVYDRAKAAGTLDGLKTYVPPPDRRLSDTSSWINYFLDRDSRPGAERP